MTTTAPTAGVVHIRRATGRDLPSVARSLAHAFFDYPVFRWAYPDDEGRRELLPAFFSLFAETLLAHGATFTTTQGTGAALWAPPAHPAVPEESADAFGQRLGALSGVDAERVFEISKLIDEHHPPGSYFFLQFMGVQPERQGRGIGSALLTHVLAGCDREGVGAYLDATSPRNRQFYERHGFRATGEYAPEGGPPLWPMWREPGDRPA